MKRTLFPRAACAALTLCVAAAAGAQQPAVRLSTPEEFKAEFESVPCRNEDRLAAVKVLFEKAGAPASAVAVEKFKGGENLVLRKEGATAEKIVVGAHYDKIGGGCGAVDNWTGVVVLARLYATVKDAPLRKTLVFVAFGEEERGLVGSRAMAKAIPKEEAAQYCAMINLDSFGLSAPQALDNASSKKLVALAETTAREMRMPFAHARVEGANSDSASFVEKKIPALTLHGLNNDWQKILHGSDDKPAKVNPASVYLGYRLALSLLARLDPAACDAHR